MWLGPNAVLAFAREGYKLTDVNVKDLIDALGYRYVSFKQLLKGSLFLLETIDSKVWILSFGFGFFESKRFITMLFSLIGLTTVLK